MSPSFAIKVRSEFQCQIELTRTPVLHSDPDSPLGLAINEWLVSGTHLPSEAPVLQYQVSAEAFGRCFHKFYPKLSLPEIAQLVSQDSPLSRSEWCQLYAPQQHKHLNALLDWIPKLPDSFTQWVQQKEAGIRELVPLLRLPEGQIPGVLRTLLQRIAEESLGRVPAAQALDQTVDLLEMNQGDPLQRALETSDWLTELRLLRYPHSSNQDRFAQEQISSTAWPKEVKVRWERQGDRSGLRLESFISGSPDWIRLERAIKKSREIWLEQESKFWPPSESTDLELKKERPADEPV